MLPLTFANVGEVNVIQRIGGNSSTKQHLENLGFVVGSRVTVLTLMGGNVIVKIKESRVALSQELAAKIMI